MKNKQKELSDILGTNFGLTVKINELDNESAFLKRIQEALAIRIELMINTNMDRLMQNLYQIDVPDHETSAAFDLGEIKKVSMKIAEIVIRRQLQKIDYSRKFYNQESNKDKSED